jgi:hypothetical protein
LEDEVSLEYALITDSSLPIEVKESDYYVSVDKEQWIDLVDYSENLVNQDSSQKILFLIVAKGTAEQESEDSRRREIEQQELNRLSEEKKSLEHSLSEQDRAKQEQDELAAQNRLDREDLRSKSKSIFNALYRR